jgi:cysteine desulfurase
VFLDFQATTPVDGRVLASMLPFFTEHYGNPHSTENVFGREADAAVARARQVIAQALSVDDSGIIFTAGATEANNLFLRGVAAGAAKGKAHIISCVTEHRSVYDTVESLRRAGHAVTLLPVDSEGLIDLESLERAFTPFTTLVSVMAVNSEIGVLQPLADIGRLCQERGIPLHTDAAQAFGKIDLDLVRDHVDAMSLSAHKIYGPKGIGALYLSPRLRTTVRPQMTGGGQQGGLRSGTIPTPLVVGFAEATRLMQLEGKSDEARIRTLRDRFVAALRNQIDGLHINGSLEHRVSGNINLRVDGIDADSLLMAMPDVALSTGSACNSGAIEPSTVLQALGLSRDQANASFRAGFGRGTSEADVDYAVKRIVSTVRALA